MATLSLNTTTAFLAGVSVVQLAAALRAPSKEAWKANVLGACVCVVAFLHYRWMRDAGPQRMIELRYGDWIVTCPLLIWELQALTGVEGQQWVVAASVVMILLGYAAVKSDGWRRHALFTASSAVLAAIVLATLDGAKTHREAVAAFFGLWALYPVAFLLDSNAMYNVLDAFSKACFGLLVAFTAT